MKHGFTLVESLVVGGIVAVIAGISLINFNLAQVRSRDVSRKNDVRAIMDALYKYHFDYGEYPAAEMGKIVSCGAPNYVDACAWHIGSFGEPEGTIYLFSVPGDPARGGREYMYEVNTDRTQFKLYASLENKRDKEIVSGLDKNCGNVKCNWGIYSQTSSTRDLHTPF